MITYKNDIKKLLKNSEIEASKLGSNYIGTEHILLAILKSNTKSNKILNNNSITYDKVLSKINYKNQKNFNIIYTPLLKRIIYSLLKENKLNIDNILIKIIEVGEGIAISILNQLQVDIKKIYLELNNNEIKYGICLNNIINQKHELILERENEINEIIEVLLRKNKNNPLLIGNAGVGKTAIIEELAYRINNKNVPYELYNKKIISINISEIISGTKYRGDFEEKLHNIIKYFESNNNLIMFIDEIHTIFKTGSNEGTIDAANILKPYLSRNRIKCIGATTKDEYNEFMLNDKAFNRRFYKIDIKEPNIEQTINILNQNKKYYEEFHNVIINKKQIKLIVNLTNKYVKDRFNPDKSFDLLDKICSKVKLINYNKNKKSIEEYKKQKTFYIKSNNFEKAISINQKIKKIDNNKIKINDSLILNNFKTNNLIKIGFK